MYNFFLLNIMSMKFINMLYKVIDHLFSWLFSISVCEDIIIYLLISLLMGIWVVPSFDYYEEGFYEHSSTYLLINKHFCWI